MPHPCFPARFIAQLKKFDGLCTILNTSYFLDGDDAPIEDDNITCVAACKVPEANEQEEASDDDIAQDNQSDSSIGELYPGEAQVRANRPPVKHCLLCINVSLL